MGNKIFIGFLVVLILGVTLAAREYLIGLPAQVNWFAAQQFCVSMGYTFTSIESKDDLVALQTYLITNDYDGYTYWISGNNLADQNKWYWQGTGKKLSYKNWAPGEPNNAGGNERCMVMLPNGLWNDLPCGSRRSFICQKDT